jgi:hypothetical protein
MSAVQSIKLSVVCGAVLGASIACLIAFAQSPTPVQNSFATPTPNPAASPPPGVQASGVAVPVPALNMAQYLQGGAHEDPDVILLLEDIQKNFNQALDELSKATPGSSQVTQALGKALIYDKSLSVNKNLACATCHVAYSGFTGASSFFNGTTSAAPGTIPMASMRCVKYPFRCSRVTATNGIPMSAVDRITCQHSQTAAVSWQVKLDSNPISIEK